MKKSTVWSNFIIAMAYAVFVTVVIIINIVKYESLSDVYTFSFGSYMTSGFASAEESFGSDLAWLATIVIVIAVAGFFILDFLIAIPAIICLVKSKTLKTSWYKVLTDISIGGQVVWTLICLQQKVIILISILMMLLVGFELEQTFFKRRIKDEESIN